MREAMRASLKEALMHKKKVLRNQRAAKYYDHSEEGETPEEEAMESPEVEAAEQRSGREMGTDNKGLSAKVSEAEESAHEEMNEAGDWREEEMKQFMKKRVKPKTRKEGTFVAIGKAAKSGMKTKKG